MKNPNWTRQTNKERKAARGKRSTHYVANPSNSRFSRRFARYAAKVQAAKSAQLACWHLRARLSRNGQAYSFVKWWAETEGRIPGAEYPAIRRAVELALAENILEMELVKRKMSLKFPVSRAILSARHFYPEYP